MYHPDGKLKARADDGVPVSRQVVLVDNSDFSNTSTTGTWTAGTTGTGVYGHNYHTHAVGAGTDAFQEFERIEFDVPLATDADGFLFQLGSVSWLSAPTFVLGVTRQLEVVDAKGEHESYVQIAMEFHCALDADLQTLGHRSRWWFRGAGSTFSEWLKVISRDPVWQVVAMKSARDFSVTLEEV